MLTDFLCINVPVNWHVAKTDATVENKFFLAHKVHPR